MKSALLLCDAFDVSASGLNIFTAPAALEEASKAVIGFLAKSCLLNTCDPIFAASPLQRFLAKLVLKALMLVITHPVSLRDW